MGGLAIGWLPRGELTALGWTLLHFCWQGAVIAVTYALGDRFTLRASARIRYAVALGALMLMPLAVLATFANEIRMVTQVQRAVTASVAMQPKAGNVIHEPISNSDRLSYLSRAEGYGGRLVNNAERILPWVDGIWMLGVLLLAVRTLGGWWQLERMRQKARGIVPMYLERSFQHMCKQIRVGQRVMLRVSDEVISPLVMGIWKTTVILPMSAVMRLTEEELEAVLAHELGHIRRWDYACNLLQTTLESVLFFHPAVWWLSRIVREQREICCDEIAVRSCSNAVVYAQTLLRLEEQKIAEFQMAIALRGNRGSLLRRVKKVLGEDGPMETQMTGGVRVAVASVVVFGLLLVPKASDAVAASRPMIDHVMTTMPGAASATVKEKLPNDISSSSPLHAVRKANEKVPGKVQPDSETAEISSLSSDGQRSSSLMIQTESKAAPKGISYIDGMREAGYPLDLNNDLNTLVSLKSLGVTPEYAKQMSTLGLGKPTVHELISLKSLDVTPEYVAELKQSGIGPKDFREVVTEKALGITSEYSAAMKKTGLGDLNLQELISLKAQNVTPEYIAWLKQQFPSVTLDELRRAAVFHLDDKFIAEAKSHGFDGKDLDKLLRLKMSGLLDD